MPSTPGQSSRCGQRRPRPPHGPTPRARAYVRNLAASADEQELDKQGRITLSAAHRDYAGLDKECVVIGSVDFIEIWDAAAWRRYLDDHEGDFADGDDDSLAGIL